MRFLLTPVEALKFASQANPLIFNASFTRPIVDLDADSVFLTERVKNSLFFDIEKLSDASSPFPHMFPKPHVWREHLPQILQNKSPILLYDDFYMVGAARAFWMLHQLGRSSYIINGHIQDLKKAGFAIESGPYNSMSMNVSKAIEPAKKKSFSKTITYAEIKQMEKEMLRRPNEYCILDARNNDRFQGRVDEPRR